MFEKPALTPILKKRFEPISWTLGLGALALATSVACSMTTAHRADSASDAAERAIRQSVSSGLAVSGRMSDVPEFSASRSVRGDASGANGNPARLQLTETRRALERMIAEDPSPERHRALGRTYLAEGKSVEAFMQLQLASQQFPSDARLHNDLGLCCLEAGRDNPDTLAEAGGHFDRALELDPNLIEALYNRARYLELSNQLPGAIKAWEAYLQRDSASPWAKQARERIEFLKSVAPVAH